MPSLLYLEIISGFQQTTYASPFLEWRRNLTPDVTFFDLDNLSDSLVIHYAIDLLEQSVKAVVLINVISAQAPVGKIHPLLEKCVAGANSLLVLVGDEHALINRYANLLPAERRQKVADLSVARRLVVSFLNP